MGIFKGMTGMIRMEITAADPLRLLDTLRKNDVIVYDVEFLDALTFRLSVSLSDRKTLQRLVEQAAAGAVVIEKKGMYWLFYRMRKRPVLLAGLFVLLFLLLWLPQKVLFIQVSGNETVPTRYILEKAEYSGLKFGSDRSDIRSEVIKNRLLSEIPALQWVGINTSGCVATISVKERSMASDSDQEVMGISSIVASRDGIIREQTVLKGTLTCEVGQAVTQGQTLISGYTDCGILIKGTRAEGEIYAETVRKIEVVTPVMSLSRGRITRTEKKYSVIFGKKLINFYTDSGNYDATCVKMYEQSYISLPGQFDLPVILITETWVYYDTEESTAVQAEARSWVTAYAEQYLRSQMIAGQILRSDITAGVENELYRVGGYYTCLEMIGQVKNEEIIEYDG